MAGNAESCVLNRKISFLCEIKVVEVNSGQRVRRQRIPRRRKLFWKRIVHRYAIYNFSQIMSLPIIHNAHHCYSQELHEGGRVKKSKKWEEVLSGQA